MEAPIRVKTSRLTHERPLGSNNGSGGIHASSSYSDARPSVDDLPPSDIDRNMTGIEEKIAPFDRTKVHDHKGVVPIPVHRVVGLLREVIVVIRIVYAHVHASGIQALKDEARAVNVPTRLC